MGFIQRIFGALLGLVFLAAVFVFASLTLGVLLVAGLALWGWLWWRARMGGRGSAGGAIIEGEFRDITPRRRTR